ncbi:RNA-binding protein [Candidatus Babeliales bacterium]|nr:RNA-binding protein [Candidatus Babeliales bacterium]
MEKLYVGNLPSTATQESVEALFSQYGPIESVVLIKDRETGLFKGFGFVEFQSKEDANKALELNGKDFEGQQLKVNVARPKNPNRY